MGSCKHAHQKLTASLVSNSTRGWSFPVPRGASPQGCRSSPNVSGGELFLKSERLLPADCCPMYAIMRAAKARLPILVVASCSHEPGGAEELPPRWPSAAFSSIAPRRQAIEIWAGVSKCSVRQAIRFCRGRPRPYATGPDRWGRGRFPARSCPGTRPAPARP